MHPLRPGEGLIRGRFEIDRHGSIYTIDAHYLDFDERIRLYQDGQLVDVARRKARFHLDGGGWIEAACAQIGMKYVRFHAESRNDSVPLQPAAGTAEAWRERIDQQYPRLSRILGAIALMVVLAVLLIELPQLVNLIGDLTPLIGLPGFQIPAVSLAWWANAAVIVIGGLAALDRSLSMRYTPLLDD